MTNKEAIEIITQIKEIIANDISWSSTAKAVTKEAFDLAISTLKTMPEADEKPTKYICGKCGNVTTYRFIRCPRCGADEEHCY